MLIKTKRFWWVFCPGMLLVLVALYLQACDRLLLITAADDSEAVKQILSWIVEGKSIPGVEGPCPESELMTGVDRVFLEGDAWRQGAAVGMDPKIQCVSGQTGTLFLEHQYRRTAYLRIKESKSRHDTSRSTLAIVATLAAQEGAGEYLFVFQKHFFAPHLRVATLKRLDTLHIAEELAITFQGGSVERDNDAKIIGMGLPRADNIFEKLIKQKKVGDPSIALCMQFVSGIKGLQDLHCHWQPIGDAEMKGLHGHNKLQKLDLTFSPITDEGLSHIAGASELTELKLSGAKITDAGMEIIKGFVHLRTLAIGDTSVTDAGLSCLKGLTKLEHLYIDGAKITNKGLQHIKAHTRLETLGISGTSVTDEGLDALKDLFQLRDLYVPKTVTSDAMNRLNKRLKDVKITKW